MDQSTDNLTAVSLPKRLESVFRSLRNGKHICRADGADYFDVERHEEDYRSVLQALGYKLVHHPQGFYYVVGHGPMTAQRLRAITLFMLILFQDLEDNKFKEEERSWERTLQRREFRIAELPHFETAQRRTMLDAVGVTPVTIQPKVLRFLKQLGIVDLLDDDRFMFRPPVHRFLDLFLEYADDTRWSASPNHAVPSDSDDASDAGVTM